MSDQQNRICTKGAQLSAELQNKGYKGLELFEKMASTTIEKKEQSRSNRCARCWHDAQTRCICHLVPDLPETRLSIKVLILMHFREYLSAGDDAKLILAMLPPDQAELFVFGKQGDWERFKAEVAIDPVHTLTLWPGEGAQTCPEFISNLPDDSPWRNANSDVSPPHKLPTLRVIVLDGVYSQARNMFKTMKKALPTCPPYVALHPETLSVYHRALKNYGESSAKTVEQSSDPKALHICTVEAFALLLKELGEWDETTQQLVAAVVLNNEALVHSMSVRPEGGKPTSESSGAARRRRRKEQPQVAGEVHVESAALNDSTT
jgi:DTW domain-containing protein YfiP